MTDEEEEEEEDTDLSTELFHLQDY